MAPRVYARPGCGNTYLVCTDHHRWTLALDGRVMPIHVTRVGGTLAQRTVETRDALGRVVVLHAEADRVRVRWHNTEQVLESVADGHELGIARVVPVPRGAQRLDMVVGRRAIAGEPLFMLLAEIEWADISQIAVRFVQTRFRAAQRALVSIIECVRPATQLLLWNTLHALRISRHIHTEALASVSLVPAADDAIIIERPVSSSEVERWLRHYHVPRDRYQIPHCAALADVFFL